MNTLTIFTATLAAVAACAADAPFSKIILDPAYIAYERDVGDLDGDGKNDVVAVQEGNDFLAVFRAPDWKRSVVFKFVGEFRWPRPAGFLSGVEMSGGLPTRGGLAGIGSVEGDRDAGAIA